MCATGAWHTASASAMMEYLRLLLMNAFIPDHTRGPASQVINTDCSQVICYVLGRGDPI